MAKSKSYTFPFPYSDRAEKVLEMAHEYANTPEMIEKEVVFEGEIEGNTVKGYIKTKKVEGTYLLIEEEMTITIHKKPFIVPWKLIEKQIELFLQAEAEEIDNFIQEAEKSLRGDQ